MDKKEFEIQLLKYSSKLYCYALKLTSSPDKANDLLQETFLKALLNYKKYSNNNYINSWLHVIMKNLFINDYRKKVKGFVMPCGSSNELYFVNSKDKQCYNDLYSRLSTKEMLIEISKLTDDYRVPFQMHIDGYKYNEIAKHLQIPMGTVKSRIYIARKKLETSIKR